MKGILGIIALCMTVLLAGGAYADEPIKITEFAAPGASQTVQFDGEWSFLSEWKATSEVKMYDDGDNLPLFVDLKGNYSHVNLDNIAPWKS